MDIIRKLVNEKTINFSRKYFFVVQALLLLSLIFAFLTVSQPLHKEEKVLLSNIVQKLNFELVKETLPENIMSVSDTIFTKTQKNMKVKISSVITSGVPVNVNGSYDVRLKMVSEGLWEKDTVIKQNLSFEMTGEECRIINDEFFIDLKQICDEIDRISNEVIGVRSGTYSMLIKPEIKGNISCKGQSFPVFSQGQMEFEIGNGEIRLKGEKAFVKEVPVEERRIIKKSIKILGIALPLNVFRYIFIILSFVLLITVILMGLIRCYIPKTSTAEEEKINKKYNSRLVRITCKIDMSHKVSVRLESFKSLVRIADEKDSAILVYQNPLNHQTFYYLIDGEYIYNYAADSLSEAVEREEREIC